MNPQRAKLKSFRTIERVRELREQIAQGEVGAAEAALDTRERAIEGCRLAMRTLNEKIQAATVAGLPMSHFIRLQALRECHMHAVSEACTARDEAKALRDAKRAALKEAHLQYKVAGKCVENMQDRVRTMVAKLEQKQSDDNASTRWAFL